MKGFTARNLIFSFLFFFLCFLFSGNSAQASMQDAVQINLDQHVFGSVSDDDPENYYKVSLPSDGNLKISLKNKAYSSWNVTILDSSGSHLKEISTDSSELVNGYSVMQVGLPKGDYYIEVSDYYYASDITYDLIANFESSNFYEKEFNNSLSSANPISLNQTYKGNLRDEYDTDFYKIDVPNNGNITLSMKRVAGKSWMASLYDSKGQELDWMNTDSSELIAGNETLQVGVPKGTYYVQIENYSDAQDEPYEFNVGYEKSEYYEKEFNNSITYANAVELNKTYKGKLRNSEDNDFFKFDVPANGNVTLSIKQKEGVSWYGHIQNEKGQVFTSLSTDSSELVKGNGEVSVGLPKGTYYVNISDYSYAGDIPYEFQVKYSASNYFEKEFNNSLSTANSINLNKTYYGTIQGENDKDLYKVVVPQNGYVSLAVRNQSGASWYAHIQNDKGNTYKDFNSDDSELVKGNTHTEVWLNKGTYYIDIEEYSYARNKQYAFSVSLLSSPLKDSQISIQNNTNKPDTIKISSIAKDDIIKVYNSKYQLLSTAKSSGSSTTISIKQLGQNAGKVYVTVTHPSMLESYKIAKSFSKEYVMSSPLKASQISIKNNKNKSDSIKVSSIAKGDIIKVYNSKSQLLLTAKSSGSSTTLSIKQLGQNAGKVYVTVTHPGMLESYKIAKSFSKEYVMSSPLKASQISIKNNKNKSDSIKVRSIAKGDIIKVYNSKSQLLSTAKSSGSSTTIYIKQLGKNGGKVYVTITHPSMLESYKVAKSFKKE